MLKSALKKNQGPMPSDNWSAPADWDKSSLIPSAPSLLTNNSSSSTRSPSFNTATTDTTNGSKARSVGFSSSASFSTGGGSAAGESLADLALPKEGKQVYRIYRFHTRMQLTHALLVDEKTEDCMYYIDYGNTSVKGWFCRMFRGQDTSGELVYIASRGTLSSRFELTRFGGDNKQVTSVSNSGMITTKYGFKGYDGQTFAWKSRTGGYELINYSNNKGKSKTTIGSFTSGMISMKKDSYITFESPADPRAAELFLLVAFSIEDHEISSNYSNHATPLSSSERAHDRAGSSDDDIDHR